MSGCSRETGSAIVSSVRSWTSPVVSLLVRSGGSGGDGIFLKLSTSLLIVLGLLVVLGTVAVVACRSPGRIVTQRASRPSGCAARAAEVTARAVRQHVASTIVPCSCNTPPP